MRTPHHLRPTRRRGVAIAALAAALVVPLSSCGSDGSTSGDTIAGEESGDDEPVIPDLPEVAFESEPMPGGALFGDGPDAGDPPLPGESTADGEVVVVGGDTEDGATESMDIVVEPCPPDDDECVPKPDVVPDEPPHVVAEEWVPFCGLLEQLDEQPIPSDEFEQIMVIRVWLGELRAVAPAAITDQLDVLLGLLDLAVEAESIDPIVVDEQTAGEGQRAADEIGTVVDLECYGDG